MSEVEPYIVDHEDPRLNQDNPSAESSTDAVVQSSAVTRRTARIAAGVSAIEELFPTIRLSQFNALTKFRDFISSGQTRGHFRMPTGAGKTVLFGLIVKLLKEKTLILVPNINLLTATRNELVDTLGMSAEEIGLVGGGSNENGKNITVMTYQSFLTRGAPEGVTTVIFDEVHRSLGAQTREAVDQVLDGGIEVEEEITEGEEAAEIEALERLESMDILSIGFTATTQLSTKNVTEIHGPEIDNVSYSDLISAGILKSVEVHPVTAEMDSEEEKGQMTKEKEDRILMASKIYDSTLIEFRTFFDSFTEHPIRTIAFCHSLAACDLFQEKAREAGFRTTIVTGHQGDLQSAEQQMLDGEIDIIITVDKLKEGWNFRPLNTVLWLRSTGSPGPLIQGAGRAMRAYLLEKVMHLFEAEWRLSYRPTKGPPKGEKGAPTGEGTSNRPRISRKAMTFAQALLAMGESLRGVLANDVLPHHIIYIDLDEFGLGTSEKYGEVCGLNAYAPSLDMSPHAFKGVVAAAKINPCEGILGRRPPHTAIDLYSKSDIDKVFEGIVRFGEHKYKEVDGHGLCGGLFAYSRSVRLAVSTVEKLVEEKR
ncbi:DEAD/DEAH box helicase family protein [Candidatus Peregrinibacteria bacterium]|nr:DEAD/DEAH box helicase family protein [Candidatus Peregrinibacteria bacterium]